MRQLTAQKSPTRARDAGAPAPRISSFKVVDQAGETVDAAEHGERATISIAIEAPAPRSDLRLFLHIENDAGLISTLATKPGFMPPRARHELRLELPALPLLRGSYVATAKLTAGGPKHVLDEAQMVLEIKSALKNGVVRLEHAWELV